MNHADPPSSPFQDDLAVLAEQLKDFISERVPGFDAGPEAIDQRRQRALAGFRYFAKTYFPHYVSEHDSVLHRDLYERLPRLVADVGGRRRGVKLAVAAPRGEAKSTLITQLFTLWCAISGRRKFIPIIMDAHHQAAAMLEAIKAELEINPRLSLDFPEQCGAGPVWKEGVAVTAAGAKFQTFGSGKRMRGLRHGSQRPDLVICDDLENDDNVRSPSQRDKLERWMRNAVLKLGPADDSMDVICVGTILHHDALLARLMNNPLWESVRFQAIIKWPDDMALWDRWGEILVREGEAAADRFHADNRAAMEAGARVSWPRVRSLSTLMKMRVRDGVEAFDAELQNQPMPESAIFRELTFWDRERDDGEWVCFGAVDPSMGKSGRRGDPSAILVGGYDRLTGVLYVLEADIRRRPPARIIDDVIAYQAQYDCRSWVVETVQFQEFFKDEIIRRSAELGEPVPVRGVKPTRDKGLRIERLQPHIANGLIRFHRHQETLIAQLRHWGEGASHDDGPDALEMLWRLAVEGGTKLGEYHSLGRRPALEGAEDHTDTGLSGDTLFGGGMAWDGY